MTVQTNEPVAKPPKEELAKARAKASADKAKAKKKATADKIKAANAAKKAELKTMKEKVKAVKEKAAEKAKAELDKKLAPLANEINVRFEKAAKMEAGADDHRLAAALQLAEARRLCEAAKANFKEWAEKNVPQAYETVRKLVAVGNADDPKLALADMRGKNNARNADHRKKKAEKVKKALKAVEELGEDAEEADEAESSQGTERIANGADAVIAAFDLLKASEKMTVAEYVADAVGAKLSTDFDA